MVRVSVALRAGESCNQHVRPESSNFLHQGSERNIMPAPFLERLLWGLRETEICDRTEALFYPVEAVCF